jgi:putative hydrolase of HD superfamily
MTHPTVILNFVAYAEKLKTLVRHSYTSNSERQESVAEHTWMLCLLATLLFHEIEAEVDQLRVLKMLIVHDLVEVFAGDIPAFVKEDMAEQEVYQKERDALNRLTGELPQEMRREIIDLWEEFEACSTTEARVATAIDKVEAVIQHNLADIRTWSQEDFDYQPYVRNELFDFDPYIRKFKDQVDLDTMKKVEGEGSLDRVSEVARERYRAGS